jgi:hypothetical protein
MPELFRLSRFADQDMFGVIAAHGRRQIHIIPANRRSPLNFQITIREHDLGNYPRGIDRPSL